MNIYKVSQSVNNDYDTYDSMIVVASSEEEAKAIQPGWSKNPVPETRKEAGEFYNWAAKEDLKVHLIGKATEGLVAGTVLCASYNAG